MIRAAWKPHEIETLRQFYPSSRTDDLARALGRTVRTVYQKARSLGLSKSAEYLSSPDARRLDGKVGSATRFQKGQTSWNKGVKGITGTHPNSVRTQFKKGQMSGKAQHNYVPIGSHRISKDGYLERKVTDDPALVPTRRWVAVHRLVWEEANGPIPKGHVVCFRPGRRTAELEQITADALELVHRAELGRRNHPKNRSPEYWQLVQLKGAITRQVNRIAREAKEAPQ